MSPSPASRPTPKRWYQERSSEYPWEQDGLDHITRLMPAAEPFRAWKDTVNVAKGDIVRFVVRYDDYPGKWMFHCHILDHEDNGMMGILEVR